MTKYREILRLKSLGFSERNIAHSCGVSRNTVAKVVKKAAEIKLSWPLDHDMTDSILEEMLFPKTKSATNKRMPDYDYIRRELLRNGVNKKLLLRTHQTPFNSRPHTEVDMDRKSLLMAMMNFQFTTSHGGRPSLMRIWRSRSLFQFTTSHGGRREVANYENIMDLCAF